jgi:2,4-dienoyl-CoA reductase-like NADH-dependent reductase (Old Yellow Enzyme family)/thioredoxin reductase
MAPTFENLLSPGIIDKMKLKNRIVMPPMERNYATPDGFITRQMIDHYAARAKGGIGLAIVEATFICPSGKGFHQQPGIYDDKCIPGLSNLSEAVKEWGCKIAIQIHHAGRQTTTAITGMPLVAPSPIPNPGAEIPRELTIMECEELVEAFGQAARRAKEAGFDAVELHGAHGYLFSQFLSARSNRRTDKYGGDLKGRMSFLLESVRRVRELVGKDFPVIFRINGEDGVEGGLTVDDTKLVARNLQEAGVDALDISAGTPEAWVNPHIIGPTATMFSPRGHLVPLAAQIKSAVSIPVITVSSITPAIGEEILRQGKADLIGMGRELLADPELPNKLASGKHKDIRPCIRCNDLCLGRLDIGVRCTVNAEVGLEGYAILPAAKRKIVAIIGGGPAGMECARIASLRGHDVSIFEKNTQLGGHLIEGTIPEFKKDVRNYKEWLIGQVKKLDIHIKLGEEFTPHKANNLKPDVIVLATGSVPIIPEIPGIRNANVVTAIDILLGKVEPKSKIIVIGGGAVGCEVALYLAEQKGKKISIIEMLPDIAGDALPTRSILLTRLVDAHVEVLTNLKVIEIGNDRIVALGRDHKIVNVEGDQIVLATGLAPRAGLYALLKDKASEVYLIGDACIPARIGEATRDGHRIGNIL